MDKNSRAVLRLFVHAESAEWCECFHTVLRILHAIISELHHQFHVDITRRQIVVHAVIHVVDVFHPSVGNGVGDVEQVEDIHTDVHIPDISQRVPLAEAARLADELLAEADVDATIGGITARRLVKVGVVAVVRQAHAERQGHIDTPCGKARDVILEKQ